MQPGDGGAAAGAPAAVRPERRRAGGRDASRRGSACRTSSPSTWAAPAIDVSIVQRGRVASVTQGEVDGLPVRLPMIEIRTIGAGGGSIARVEAGGRLTVGPASAGARPGPVCYGRGGTEPTVTDANLALGRIDPEYFLGGAMELDAAAARQAICGEAWRGRWLSAEDGRRGHLRGRRLAAWRRRSGCRCSRRGSTRGISRCCRSAAPAGCMRARRRRRSASTAWSFRAIRAR